MTVSSLQTCDIANCDREPIRIPSHIQPHGMLLTLHPETKEILQASANVAGKLGREPGEITGKTLPALLGHDGAALLEALARQPLGDSPTYLQTMMLGTSGNISYNMLAHRHDGLIFLEMEETPGRETVTFQTLYPAIHAFTSRLQSLPSLADIYRLTAQEVQHITGYDRVLIYRFDGDWHGEVLAEARLEERFPSLLGHHFPASDIPKQARELYRLNRLRIIPDAGYAPVPIFPAANPLTGQPLDMTYSTLRSVSPIHVEYMKNMDTGASMSISILVNDRLWGLISCHNREPRHVPFEMRTACDFIGQFLSLQIAHKEHSREYEHRMTLKAIGSKLLGAMTVAEDFIQALKLHRQELLTLAGASGAAIIFDRRCTLLGSTPDAEAVLALVEWLGENQEEVFHTVSLSSLYPAAAEYRDLASGLLYIAISKLHSSCILWFRPEVLQEVQWGGDPTKHAAAKNEPIQPHRSFATWLEVVRLKSFPWRESEIDAASEFRNAVVGIVLRKAEELAELSAELERSNKELEAFSHSVSHDLRAPFRHIVGYSEMIKETEAGRLSERGQRYLDNVIESGRYAGQLVDNLLHFSQVGRLPIDPIAIDMNKLVKEIQQELMQDAQDRTIHWHIAPLPTVQGDLLLMRLVWYNLLANAVKYSAQREQAHIEIACNEAEKEYIFQVKDNGIGFEMQYVDKLFGVFQRLHKMEDFEGTGIGLANVKRIITRKGGRVWAEGEPDKGASFYFTIPKPEEEE